MSNLADRRTASADALGSDLLSAVARLNRFATQQAGLDLPFAQVRLLALVDERGPARIGDLAALDSCSQPTMTAQVRRLEAQGLVDRVDDPSDARAVLVSVTAAGRRLLDRAREARGAVLAPYVTQLDGDDLAALERAVPVLQRLVAAAQRDATGTPSSTTPHRKES
ncbi:MarR family winged helix-turn-helix transcriptional regulator [Lapillicoccus jejuensis]|uniref:MarR family transcriptional regulator n=1 Tax=Lapillicoccus jejuensis TaxID=402171 RepID=A0A542DZT3_9MICO|nr:MarR family transcriptional regulator [Lapillicoccus jejuensis]TQJ08590.1 MarR family transcriptional regulator [Lapillicoccus jejuensis]